MTMGDIIYKENKYDHNYIKEKINEYVELIDSVKSNEVTFILFMNRTPNLLILVIALLLRKKRFTILNVDCPNERKEYIIESVKPCIIVDDNVSCSINKENIIYKDYCNTCDNTVAYIAFTSGSTGLEKGVMISYIALENFIKGIRDILKLEKGKSIICMTIETSDIFLLESVIPLLFGMTVILTTDQEYKNPKAIIKYIRKYSISLIQITPSRMLMLMKFDKEFSFLKEVKEIIFAGEVLEISLLKKVQNSTSALIYNFYGPTEATIWCSYSNLTKSDYVHIGKAMLNNKLAIFDSYGTMANVGNVGEIFIFGKSLADGYLKNKRLTDSYFVSLPNGERGYKTGDLGFETKEGNLIYVGRSDNQIKYRGYCIELEEIEHHINQYQDIEQAVVTYDEEEQVLKAYFISDKIINLTKLKGFLKRKIPNYMIPGQIYQVERLNYNENGKLIRKNYDQCKVINLELGEGEFLSDLHKDVWKIIKKHVGVDFEINYKLKDVGIDSLEFINIIVEIEEKYQMEFNDEIFDLRDYISIIELVNYIVDYIKMKGKE